MPVTNILHNTCVVISNPQYACYVFCSLILFFIQKNVYNHALFQFFNSNSFYLYSHHPVSELS